MNPANFRPVSRLSTLLKLVKKIIETRMRSYLTSFKMITPRQYGFQASKVARCNISPTGHRLMQS